MIPEQRLAWWWMRHAQPQRQLSWERMQLCVVPLVVVVEVPGCG